MQAKYARGVLSVAAVPLDGLKADQTPPAIQAETAPSTGPADAYHYDLRTDNHSLRFPLSPRPMKFGDSSWHS